VVAQRQGLHCEVQAALEAQLSVDCVLDGELVLWTGERLDFDALQQRMVNTPSTVRRRLAPARPASFVAFDVLAVGSVDVRPMRCTARRQRLESLAERWAPPLQLSGHQLSRRGPRVAERLQDHPVWRAWS
jgi:ATP-dependent DNA ligase